MDSTPQRSDSRLKRAGSLVRVLKPGITRDGHSEPAERASEQYYGATAPAPCTISPCDVTSLDPGDTADNTPCSPARAWCTQEQTRRTALVPGAAANMPSTSDGSASKSVVLEVVNHMNQVHIVLQCVANSARRATQEEAQLLSMCGLDGPPNKLKRVRQSSYEHDRLSVMLEETPAGEAAPPSTPVRPVS